MEIEIRIISGILLLLRVVSLAFIALVIMKQLKLFKIEVSEKVNLFRRILFFMACIILVGNLIPIMLHISTLMADSVELKRIVPRTFGIAYAVSNALTSVASSFFIWYLYKMSGALAIVVEKDKIEALLEK